MNAETITSPASASSEVTTYACTFGHYIQAGPWTDVRRFSWPDFAELLTHHEIGPKEGACIVPATFSGSRRHKSDALRIDVVMLDSDAGATLPEIKAAIEVRGWAAVVSSTHSHLSTTTRAKRGNWDRFLTKAADQTTAPTAFLVAEKGYLPRIAARARIVSEDTEYVTFEHQPCPKFRVALPLLRPWLAKSFDDQRSANAAWCERIEALAAALRLNHDQACTDTSRLFYLPRRPNDGPPAETAVIEGEPCDLFALPPADRSRELGGGSRGRQGSSGGQRQPKVGARKPRFTDPETGEVVDLTVWARRYAGRFQIVTALQARRPDVFVPRPNQGTKHHVRCVNEEAHTQPGADAATFAVNASESSRAC